MQGDLIDDLIYDRLIVCFSTKNDVRVSESSMF